MSTFAMATTAADGGAPDQIVITNEDGFKKFVVDEIKAIADPDSADSDVLADYVFALVQSEKSLEKLRGNFMENLDDFLGENTGVFAEKLLGALASGSYDPSYVPPSQQQNPAAYPASSTHDQSRSAHESMEVDSQSSSTGPLSNARPNVPSGPRAMMRDGLKPPTGPAAMANAPPHVHMNSNRNDRKRERERSASVDPSEPSFSHSGPDDRSFKQMRRGAFNGFRGGAKPGWRPPAGQGANIQPPFPFDPAAGPMGFPGFPMGLNGQPIPFDPAMLHAMMGMGMEAMMGSMGAKPDEFEQPNAAPTPGWRGGMRGRGRGGMRGAGSAGRGRADFSSTAPNQDRSVRTVVVENIPAEHLSEEHVRTYFTEFGPIEELTMQPYKRLALVKYESYEGAQKAYSSPRSIFDNRFVKVYWYRPEGSAPGRDKAESTAEAAVSQPPVDISEIQRRQESFSEKQALREATEKQRKEVELKLKEQEEKRKRLLEILDRAQANAKSQTAGSSDAVLPAGAPMSETEALRAKLKELEREAQQMGIDSNAPFGFRGGRGGPRGGYRGRFPTRGRGRGRAGFYAGPQSVQCSVLRLDNRPKRVSVDVSVGTSRDEALRQYLFNHFTFDSIDSHPTQPGSQIVAFKERYVAENFMKAAIAEIPNVGKVEIGWVNNDVVADQSMPAGSMDVQSDQHQMSDVMEAVAEQDYDVLDAV